MNSSAYKRDKKRVDSCLKKVGTTLVALEPLRIQIPERFTERDLAIIEDVSYILGFLAIITEDNYYASSTVTGMLRTEPDRIGKIVVDDIPYIELFYDKGSSVFSSTKVVTVDNLVHPVYTEMLGKGNIPWYHGYEDICMMFYDTGKYNGVTLGADLALWEYLGACLCRDPDNPRQYYRHRKNVKESLKTVDPYIVSLRNVAFGATNFTSKLGGSYFDPGMTSLLAHPSERQERVENFLRQ